MVKLSKYSDKNTPAILVEIGGVKLWFSYETIVAFQISSRSPLVVSQNQWGPTTGRHLDLIDNGKGKRLPRGEFERELDKLQAQLNPTVNMNQIQSVPDLLATIAEGDGAELSDDEALERLKRIMFKYTNCGAFIEEVERTPDGNRITKIVIGSIVEGSDAQTANHEFSFPFPEEDYHAAVAEIEAEADQLWREANGPDGESDD